MSHIPMIALIVMCIGASGQPALGQPMPPVATQWKQSIERLYTDWDYDGKRILGHVDEDICLWDAATGQLLHRLKGHKEQIKKVQFSLDGRHALSSSWIAPGPMTDSNRKILGQSCGIWQLARGSTSYQARWLENSARMEVVSSRSVKLKRLLRSTLRYGTF